MTGRRHVLVLVKGQHRYLFSYEAGQEDILLDALIELATDPHSGFDPFDLVILRYQMEHGRIQEELSV
jgi:hypothetical protein